MFVSTERATSSVPTRVIYLMATVDHSKTADIGPVVLVTTRKRKYPMRVWYADERRIRKALAV
jgi:hypothetical protein